MINEIYILKNSEIELFNNFSKHYYLSDFLSLGISNILRKKIICNSGLNRKSIIIDLMCGYGNNMKIINRNKLPFFAYFGYDFSSKMLDKAMKSFGDFDKVNFIETDLLNTISPVIKSGDLIVCTFGLKCIHISEYEEFVNLVINALNYNASFSFLEIQFPKQKIFKKAVLIYLNTFCKFLNLLVARNTNATNALIEKLKIDIDFELLKKLFKRQGVDINIKKKYFESVVEIKGRKCYSIPHN